MSRTSSFILRLVGFVILVGILIAGGVLIYNAGQAQGYSMGQVAAATVGSSSSAPLAPVPPGYWPYYRPHFGFFPFGGILGLVFFGLLFFFALRLLFRPHFWGYPGMHPGERYWHAHSHHWGGPPWMKDQPSAEAGEPGSQPLTGQPPSGTGS